MQRFTEYFTLVLLAALLLWANEVPRFSSAGPVCVVFDGCGVPFIYCRSNVWRNIDNFSYSASQKLSIDSPILLADGTLALVLLGATAWRLRKRRGSAHSAETKPWYRERLQFGLSSLLVALVAFAILLWVNSWEIVAAWPSDAMSGRQYWFLAVVKGWPLPYEVKPLEGFAYEVVRSPPLALDVFCAFLIALDLGLLWECYVLRPKKASAIATATASR